MVLAGEGRQLSFFPDIVEYTLDDILTPLNVYNYTYLNVVLQPAGQCDSLRSDAQISSSTVYHRQIFHPPARIRPHSFSSLVSYVSQATFG